MSIFLELSWPNRDPQNGAPIMLHSCEDGNGTFVPLIHGRSLV